MPLDDASSWYDARGGEPYHRPPWLVRLRAISAGLQLGACLVAWALPNLDFPLRELVPLLLLLGVANGGLYLWVSRGRAFPLVPMGVVLLLEVLLLTELLEITGGPFNPFSVIYGVQVAVTVFTLGTGWAALTGAAGLAAFSRLVYTHLQPDAAVHHRLNDFPTHLLTMWVAAAVTAELVGYAVTQAAGAIERRQRELELARTRAARSERVAALTTLAAGAAHELSTPLATIAVAAKELERATATLSPESAPPSVHQDATLIRTEVDRCQAILDQMSGRAGGGAADEMERVDVKAITAQVRDRLSGDQAPRLHIRVENEVGVLLIPRAGLIQVISSLVKNGLEASGDGHPVWLTLACEDNALRVVVSDSGRGIAASDMEHVGEPFYTTKDTGRGLGLFLARVFAERFGGSLILRSGRETCVTLTLPIPARTEDG